MTTPPISTKDNLSALSEDQTELLKLLLEGKSRQTQKIRRYPRAGSTDAIRLPTSWAQQRLWFIDQLEGGTTAYNTAVTVRLRGPLDQNALRKTLDTLVQRHEVLRTVFVSAEDYPRQKIAASGRFALSVIDLSACELREREERLQLHEAQEAREKFDLGTGPLVRGRLIRMEPEEHVLLITMHHIISDGWSMAVMLREVTELYNAYCEGRDDRLQPLPIQYADYAQWQRLQLQGEVLERQLQYWRTRLQGSPPQLELPTDRPRPAVQSHRGENLDVALDAHLSAQLRAFAQRHELTLFMVLYAAWAILLARLSGQEDVLIGTPVANRRRPELESLIGFFVNTLVLRAEVRSDMAIEEFLGQIKEVTLGAYDHQDVPFEQVVEALQPHRSLSHNPLFQVMLSLQNVPKSELCLRSLSATLEDAVYESSRFDLVLSLDDAGDRIAGTLNYATDLFDRKTVERWMACFTTLLRGTVQGKSICVGDLPILPERERHCVVSSFNATHAPYPDEKLIHELFQEQAQRTPHSIALICGRQKLTYDELNCRSNQLAHLLRHRGVHAGRTVGICLERSIESVIAMLGVLKAGGAYVPLDPNYPPDRLAYLLEDSMPQVVLTVEKFRSPLRAGVTSLSLDAQRKDLTRADAGNLDRTGLTSEDLAYVMYTSGSTGLPKGVMVCHRNIVNYATHIVRELDVAAGEGSLIGTSMHFDLSLTGLYPPLICGRPVRLCEEGEDLSEALLEGCGYSPVKLTPSHLMMLSLPEDNIAGRVRTLVLGGELLRGSALRWWRKHSPQTRLLNHYGPTETTVGCVVHEVTEDVDGPVPIGRPISNTQVYILGSQLSPVPIGVVGEIYIGGAGVSRGYWKRPELTAQRFIRDPFSTDSHARLYKTGDLGRWRADGTIEYLGRNDHQVKIRGYRIELGEIEAQLTSHAQVKEAAVIAREDVPGEKRLVAYVVPRDSADANATPGVEVLRAHSKKVLPEYMVPGAFVMLEYLPLTANGKLDRRALPAPDAAAYTIRKYEAPEGEVEEGLAAVWRELLRVERVGRRDNFFDLGGHSLLATRVISRMRDQFQVELPLRALFDSPTVEQLAASIKAEADRQAALETLHTGDIARNLRQDIDEMHDEDVARRIAELERELGYT